MMLDRTSQAALLDALEELRRGAGRRFEDKLWLGFGDEWTRVRLLLLRDGSVREIAGGGPAYALLVRGEALRLRLIEALAPKADASGTSISVALAGSADS